MKTIFIFAGMAALLLSGCKHTPHAGHATGKLTVTTPVVRDTLVQHEYVCQIRSIQHIELRALEKGYLEKIYVDEGQRVRKGQLLFQIMPVINEAEVEKARAEVSFAEIEYQNTKTLADSNIVSVNELALSRAKLAKAKAELHLAEAHLSFTEIRAPFDGMVGRFNDVRTGALLDEGALLTTLSDNDKMWVYFNVPEAEYIDYATRTRSEQPVRVKLQMANQALFEEEGVIETIEADFNNETGNIAFRATFANPKRILRHGETGNILMPTRLKNALLLPQKATFEVLDRKYVYVVNADSTLTSREVGIQHEIPHVYVVSDGLKPGEKVLVDGIRKVKNGDKIQPEEQSFTAIIAGLTSLKAE